MLVIENRVKEMREACGLSQEGLGRCLGVSRQTICLIETGKQFPSLPLAFRIARYFRVEVEEVFLLRD